MITTPIRKIQEIELIKAYFLKKEHYRDYSLFILGINTSLRISDMLNICWKDVYDFQKQKFREHLILREQKTGKVNCIAINQSCKEALYLQMKNKAPELQEEYIFYSGKNAQKHISRNRAWHIIKKAAIENQLDGNISCHSLRKTFGYHAWKSGGQPALIMHIYNHSSLEVTKRYLCIDQDDKDRLFHRLNL
ncbi:MAG: tyrosine-type recombinase/integrase [Lachnospiraceae bacterium]|nr:tyrosine-type recombinase/integrase [Lachnospiraceae bacterium]